MMKFNDFNESKSVDNLDTSKTKKEIIKKIKKLNWMGANALGSAYESAKKDIIKIINENL